MLCVAFVDEGRVHDQSLKECCRVRLAGCIGQRAAWYDEDEGDDDSGDNGDDTDGGEERRREEKRGEERSAAIAAATG